MYPARVLAAALIVIGVGIGGAHAQAGRPGDVLDANTASEKQLSAVPGLPAVLVKSIVARRPFLTMAAFDEVFAPTLDAAQRAQVYRRVFVQVNVNTASDSELLLIPGLTSQLLDHLKAHRPYKTLAQFRRDIARYADEPEVRRLEHYVFVPINLNTASDADILSIPRLGPRMLQEFKEYRPYRAIQQFRREIGKYVDQTEVARLERYVTVN